MHQRLGRLLMRPVDDAVKGLSGNAHALCRILIVQALTVRQSHGLQLVGGKGDLLDLAQRNPRRLKIIHRRAMFDSSGTWWPRHNDAISHLGKDLKHVVGLLCRDFAGEQLCRIVHHTLDIFLCDRAAAFL